MIRFADEATTPCIREMWKIVFEDTEEYLDLLFTEKYKPKNTLVYLDEGKPVASLQMLPYSITFYGERIEFYYLMGLCTLPQYRRRGYMEQLIMSSHEVMCERKIPLSVLVPAEEWLFGFYEKYGYEKVFEKDNKPIPLEEILNNGKTIEEQYVCFDKCQQHDFYVQKSLADFKVIMAEYAIDNETPRTNLAGMAHAVNPHFLLNIYAKQNPKKQFTIKVDDEKFEVKNGRCSGTIQENCDLAVDIRLLCKLLFGFELDCLESKYRIPFSTHHPIINLMLE